MKLADLSNPVALAKIIAASNANTIPVNATGTSYASQTEGFPAITMIPEEQGGEAPHGLDFNGFLKMLSSHVFNIQNGTPETFNPAVSTTIGGYPKNAQLWLIDDNNSRYLKSTKDDNTDNFLTNPSVIGTSWVDAFPTKDYVDNGLATKQNTITGAASTVTTSNLTASRALVSNGSGKVAVSAVTSTELGYVHGVTSAIQTQINAKAADSAVVKLTGTQTIGGAKTFQNRLTLEQNDPGMVIKNTGYTKGVTPDAERWEGIEWQDNGGRTVARVRHRYTTGKDCYIEFQAYRSHQATDTESETFSLEYPATGTPTVKSPQLQPDTDNTHNLGVASFRWKQLYAGTTTIATSDEREKQNIEAIPDEVLDAWGEVEFYQFKFKDAVAEKGEENARYHTGLIAQRIESVFTAHGLDAHKYGLLCYDEWEDGNRYALRYEECLTMETAYQRRRADRIEARLAALEARA